MQVCRTVHQAPLSVGFSRQEYWSGLPFPSPEDLPDSGIELGFINIKFLYLYCCTACDRPWIESMPPGRIGINPSFHMVKFIDETTNSWGFPYEKF